MSIAFGEWQRAVAFPVIWWAIAVASAQDEQALSFYVGVKKSEFEKNVRDGGSRVLMRYGEALDSLIRYPFPKESATGVEEIKKERKNVTAWLAELKKEEDPLEWVAVQMGSLRRTNIELQSHLAESAWKLSDNRTLYLKRNGSIFLNGKRWRDAGWEPAGGTHFVWGGRFWLCEVRESRNRFTARDRSAPKATVQAVLVDSLEFRSGPVARMCREFAKTKLQLAQGLEILIEAYHSDLDAARKDELEGGRLDLDESLAAKKEQERIAVFSDYLFGSDISLGKPETNPLTTETLRQKLIGAELKCESGSAFLLNGRGRAALRRPDGKVSGGKRWEVLDDHSIVFGYSYHRIVLSPDLATFRSYSRTRNVRENGTVILKARR